MEQWFSGKVALVTGGGDGIGRATSLLFARRGAKVIVTDIDADMGMQTVDAIREAGGDAVFIRCDVTDRDVVAATVRQGADHYGRLDCAFNNAGITHPRDGEWDWDAFDRTIDINLKGVMNCLKAEIAIMLEQGGGAIVNTASTAAFVASAAVPLPGYTSSKHAIIGLTRTAALQYARSHIRVNALCPGVTDTEIVRAVKEYSPEAKHMLENFAPMGRMGTPEDMAEAAIWLCSDKSSFITGHPLAVDGGFLAT